MHVKYKKYLEKFLYNYICIVNSEKSKQYIISSAIYKSSLLYLQNPQVVLVLYNNRSDFTITKIESTSNTKLYRKIQISKFIRTIYYGEIEYLMF